MIRLLAFLAALLFGATAFAAAARDWSTVAAPAPQGSFVIGNLQARVKLVEYISYTCPHCRHFTEASAATLKDRMVRSGSTSVEIRNSVHDKLDLVAALLARCAGAGAFPRFHETIFARQDDWTSRGAAFDQTNGQRLQLYPQAAQLRALADGAGLTELARGAGLTGARLDSCFADPEMLARTLQVSAAIGGKIRGTPAFEINGRLIEGADWAKLEPLLRAAGAR